MPISRGIKSILFGLGLGALSILLFWAFGPYLHGRSPGRFYIGIAVSVALILWGIFLLGIENVQAVRTRAARPKSVLDQPRSRNGAPLDNGS